MTLAEYLEQNELTYVGFAEQIGVTTVTVWRYVNSKRYPRPAIMCRIMEATGGLVDPRDFQAQYAALHAAMQPSRSMER